MSWVSFFPYKCCPAQFYVLCICFSEVFVCFIQPVFPRFPFLLLSSEFFLILLHLILFNYPNHFNRIPSINSIIWYYTIIVIIIIIIIIIYWGVFYKTVGIHNPKEMLLCHSSLSSVSSSVRSLLIMLLLVLSTHYSLGFPFPSYPQHSTPVPFLEFCHFSFSLIVQTRSNRFSSSIAIIFCYQISKVSGIVIPQGTNYKFV